MPSTGSPRHPVGGARRSASWTPGWAEHHGVRGAGYGINVKAADGQTPEWLAQDVGDELAEAGEVALGDWVWPTYSGDLLADEGVVSLR